MGSAHRPLGSAVRFLWGDAALSSSAHRDRPARVAGRRGICVFSSAGIHAPLVCQVSAYGGFYIFVPPEPAPGTAGQCAGPGAGDCSVLSPGALYVSWPAVDQYIFNVAT